MDSRVHVIGGTPCLQRNCSQERKRPEVALSIVYHTTGNEHSFNVLCRNELIKPTIVLLCSAWSHLGEQLDGFHLAN